MDLNALAVFAKVVEAGSFSEAARRLSMPLSTVSRRVAELESQLKVRLLERSSRRLRLSEVGADLLELARESATLARAVDERVSRQRDQVSGTLRLSAPPSISDSILAPLTTAFQKAHPQVLIRVLITDRFVDHIAEEVDLAFRFGPLKDSGLVARRFLRYRHQLVASPEYLASRQPPRRPADLRDHRLLAFSFWRPGHVWVLRRGTGKPERLSFVPHLSMNDYAGLATALVKGVGIGDLPPVVMPELVRTGQLVEVMPGWQFRPFDLSLVHLGTKSLHRTVRAFKEFALDEAPRLFPELPS